MNTEDKRIKLLIVDDTDYFRQFLKTIFRHFVGLDDKLEIEEAENGEKALEKVFEFNPEIIITDLMMPKMNGIEFLNILRKTDTKYRERLILICSAIEYDRTILNSLKTLEINVDNNYIDKAHDLYNFRNKIEKLLIKLFANKEREKLNEK